MSWGFQKDSELIHVFNYHLQKMQESGMFEKLGLNIYDKHETNKDYNKTEEHVLGYKNVVLPFSLLLTGLFVSLLQLGIEVMKKKCESEQQEEHNAELVPWERNTSAEVGSVIEEAMNHLLLSKNQFRQEEIEILSKFNKLVKSNTQLVMAVTEV